MNGEFEECKLGVVCNEFSEIDCFCKSDNTHPFSDVEKKTFRNLCKPFFFTIKFCPGEPKKLGYKADVDEIKGGESLDAMNLKVSVHDFLGNRTCPDAGHHWRLALLTKDEYLHGESEFDINSVGESLIRGIMTRSTGIPHEGVQVDLEFGLLKLDKEVLHINTNQ